MELDTTLDTPSTSNSTTTSTVNERVRPVPKPRKSLLIKRSNTVNFRPNEPERSALKRSASTDNLLSKLMEECPNEEETNVEEW